MKVVFLDFDGVLNTIGQQRMNKGVCGMYLDDEKIKIFKTLIDATHAKIVLSTSWKTYWNYDISSCDEIGVEIHKKFSRQGLDIYDKIPTGKPFNRCIYIKKWLADMPNIEAYVVIDDLNLEDEFPANSVQTSEFVGITMDDVQKAEKILMN